MFSLVRPSFFTFLQTERLFLYTDDPEAVEPLDYDARLSALGASGTLVSGDTVVLAVGRFMA